MRLEGDTVHRMTDARERQPLKTFAGLSACTRWPAIGDPNRFFLQLGRPHQRCCRILFRNDPLPFTPKDLDFGDAACRSCSPRWFL